MSRMGAILAAAAITSIVLFTLLGVTAISLVSRGVISINTQPPAATPDPALAQLQNRQTALDQAAGVMDKRQQDYAQQLAETQMNVARLKQAIADQQNQNQAELQTLAGLQAQLPSENAVAAQLANQAAPLQQKESEYAALINAANQQILALKQQIAQITGQMP